MKQSIFLKGFLCVLVAVPLATGCGKKKDDAATTGSGAPTAGSAGSAAAAGSAGSAGSAAGSGSVVAAGSAAAGSAAGPAAPAEPQAPWAADTAAVEASSKVTGKRKGNDEGTFDRALYFKVVDDWGTARYELHIASNCEKFSCAHYTSIRGGIYLADSFYKDCPSAKKLDITIAGEADPKAGPIDISAGINSSSSGGDLSGDKMKGSSITAISDKEVKGKIAVKDGNNEAKGDFTAKNCGTMTFPKKER